MTEVAVKQEPCDITFPRIKEELDEHMYEDDYQHPGSSTVAVMKEEITIEENPIDIEDGCTGATRTLQCARGKNIEQSTQRIGWRFKIEELQTSLQIKLDLPEECDRTVLCHTLQAAGSTGNTKNIQEHAHTSEICLSCAVCTTKFNEKSHLRRHIRTHAGEKPLTCTQCLAKFSDKSALNRHIRTHTEEKPFTCTHCPVKFVDASTPRRHYLKHTREPYICALCASF